MLSKHGEQEEAHGQRCRQGTSEKEKKTPLLAVTVTCANLTDLFKNSVAHDEEEGSEEHN